MRARRSRRRLLAGIICAASALGVTACGGGDGGDGDRDPSGAPSAAEVVEATKTIEAARTCPAVYDAGAEITARLVEARSKAAPDGRDHAFDAALEEADAALAGRLRALRCPPSQNVCEEFATRSNVERGALDC